jgi:hypothetical protein
VLQVKPEIIEALIPLEVNSPENDCLPKCS